MNIWGKYFLYRLILGLFSYCSWCFAYNPFSNPYKHMKMMEEQSSLRLTARPLRNVDCKIFDLNITDCDIKVSRLEKQRIRAVYKRTCNLKEVGFVFHFGVDNKYSYTIAKEKPEIQVDEIKKHLDKHNQYLLTGTHYIYVTMNAKSLKNVEMTLQSNNCSFFVEHEKPTPSLGRTNRNVNEGHTFLVDAKKSLNNDLGKTNVGLEYRWHCNDTIDFCNGRDLGTGVSIKVDKKYAISGANFTFVLEARTQYSDWQKCTQLIYVNPTRPFSINCIGICGKEPNKLNVLKKILIIAECDFSCKKYDIKKVTGLFTTIGKGKVHRPIPQIATGPKILTSLLAKSRFKIIAYYDGNMNDIIGEQDFSTYPIPILQQCRPIPERGNPLTKFKIECSYEKDKVTNFEIHVRVNNTVVFSTTAESLDDIEFVIPSKSTVDVKLRDINDVVISQKVDVKIDPIVTETSDISQVDKTLNDILDGNNKGSKSVDELIEEGDLNNAVQVIDVVARELSHLPKENEKANELITNLTEKLLNSLDKLAVDEFDMVRSISGVISLIAHQHKKNKSESKLAMKFGKICNNLAKHQLYFLENDIENSISEKDVKSITKNLLTCGESQISPYFEIFEEFSANIEISTQYPVRDDLSENNIEEYPEYDADDLIQEQTNNFLTAAEYIVDICKNVGKSLILSSSLYNQFPTYVERGDTIVGIFKSTGTKIAGIKFHEHNSKVIISSFMENNDSIFAVRVCSYKNDPFWSSSKTFKISTNVIDLSIEDLAAESEIVEFGTKPMKISFEINQKTIGQKATVSVDFSKQIITEYAEDNFIIFIFKTKGMESFFIEFFDLDEFDSISVILSDMERPVLQQFSIAHNITKSNTRIFIENLVYEDKWFLLGLRRETNAVLKTSTFKISVYTIKCLAWDYNSNSWKHACTIDEKTNHEVMHCDCLHFSTIGGSLEFNDIKEHPKFISLNFVLEEQKSLHICITVCIILGLYFTVLLYSIHKREFKEDAVFFLSDIPAENRFGYLISTHTGNKLDAGTTSDIVIQIFGTYGKSQEHVLNFPDPFLELLQRSNNDMFVLATSKDLGRLLKINLWFDCTGTSPNWYCDEVKICDMQRKRWYVFKVNKWLRLDGTPKLFLSVPVEKSTNVPTDNKKATAIKAAIKWFLNIVWAAGEWRNSLFRPSANSEDPSFDLPKRLTLILSLLLSMMMILLYSYGIPEMTPRDSITTECYYKMDWNTVTIGIYGAMYAFLPHTAVMEIFKKSQIQYDKRKNKKWPHFYSIICWVVLIMNILIQIHALLIYGYWFVSPTTWQWTTSLVIGILFYIFILDYIYNIIRMCFGRAIKDGILNMKNILKNVEYQRKYLYSRFGRSIFRPILTPLYKVIGKTEYLRKHLFFRQKREVLWEIHDLMTILLFLLFLYVIILQEKNSTYDVLSHKEAEILLAGNEYFKNKLSKVYQIDEFEKFLEGIFIPTLQSYQWYGRYISHSPGLTTDACNRYLGIVRLRQLRAELISCNISTLMQFINRSCTATQYANHFDYLNYTPAWTDAIPEYHRSRLGYIWGYQNSTGQSYLGISGYYPKGGYVALLGRTMKNSLVNMDYLKRYSWMDILTRVIFIEFPIYNVNTNLFNFASVALEKTPAGYIHKKTIVKSVRVLKQGSKPTTLSTLFIVLFAILILLMTVRTILRIIRTKTWYRRDLWHLTDVTIVVMSITWIGMHIRKVIHMKNFVKELEEKRSNTFVDYFDLLNVESWNKILASALICVITVRIWRLLRFARVFRIVERTLYFSFESLLYSSAYFFLLCIAFAKTGFVLFCTNSYYFKDETSASKTLILMTIGIRGPNTLRIENTHTRLGYVYIVFFYIVTYFFTTIFIAIVIVNFLVAQQFSFEEDFEYNMKEYTKDQKVNIRRLARMWVRKFRLRAGRINKDDQELVKPKSNYIRYLNCVSTTSNRMTAMESIAKCVILKKKKGLLFDESDHAEMMKTVRHFCSKKGGKDERFFTQYVKGEGCRFVDNRRLLMIEKVVKRMLESPENRAARLKIAEENEILMAENMAQLEMMKYRLKTMFEVIEKISIKVIVR